MAQLGPTNIFGDVDITNKTTTKDLNVTGATILDKFVGVGATPGTTFASTGVGIAIGDTDTGIKQDGDGKLELWSNNIKTVLLTSTGITFYKTITGTLTGNSSSATKLKNAQNITLSGDITTITKSFNGTAGINFAVVIKDNSHNHTKYVEKTNKANEAQIKTGTLEKWVDAQMLNKFIYTSNEIAGDNI